LKENNKAKITTYETQGMFDNYNQQTNDCDINGQTTLLDLEEMLRIWEGNGKGGKQHEQKHLVWKNTSMLL